jgi:hypothetical protein
MTLYGFSAGTESIKKGFELNAVSRTINPKCKVHRVRSEPFSNPSAPGRNYQSILLHKVCADRESNPESPETEARIMLNIPVSMPQTNCATKRRTRYKGLNPYLSDKTTIHIARPQYKNILTYLARLMRQKIVTSDSDTKS